MPSFVHISLSEPMKQWVEQQVAARGFESVGAFFCHLVREEQRRVVRRCIDDQLHAALDGGPSTLMTPADWDRLRREAHERLARKRANG